MAERTAATLSIPVRAALTASGPVFDSSTSSNGAHFIVRNPLPAIRSAILPKSAGDRFWPNSARLMFA